MTAGATRRVDGRRNRERLVQAAEELIARDGAQASLEEIARRAGVGSATLHRHFPSRHVLLEAVFHEGIARLVRQAAELAENGTAPGPALTDWLERLTEYTAATRGMATALLADPDARIAESDTCHGLIHEATDRLVARAATAGVLRAEVGTDDLLAVANALSLVSEGDPERARRLLRLTLTGAFTDR
jgi:AcrR family transcriptional regulator